MITDLDQLQETLSRKLNLYQQCSELTQRVADVIEAEDGVLVIKLLKQRDALFHKIRQVDAQAAGGEGQGAPNVGKGREAGGNLRDDGA